MPAKNKTDNRQLPEAQQDAASGVTLPTATSEKSGTESKAPLDGPASQKGRSLPAGIETKFKAGDLTFRLVAIRMDGQTNNNWLLTALVLVKNTGPSSFGIYYHDHFRLLINNNRHAPTKARSAFNLRSDSEESGEVTFVVPQAEGRVGFRITYGDEQTTIPLDLKSGVSRSDVQPPGVPRSLAPIARMDNIYNGSANYEFRAVTLEPYNVESFILRLSVRVTTNNRAFGMYSDSFRLVYDDLPHKPVKAPGARSLSAQTYADVDILFVVPKSVARVSLRVPDGDNWRNVPIDLKAGEA